MTLFALLASTLSLAAQDPGMSGFEPARTVDARVRASVGYLDDQRWRMALSLSRQVAESGAHPRHRAAAENNSCIALSALGRHGEAVEACARATELRPADDCYAANLDIAMNRAALALNTAPEE